MKPPAPPAGYEAITVGRATAVAVPELVAWLESTLGSATLYDYARQRTDAQALSGRRPVYAIPTPDGTGRLVVRHNRHGGLVARLTGDRFPYPTRAPYELQVSTRLAAAGVATPQLLAYVIYRERLFATSDVATRLVEGAPDLAHRIAGGSAESRPRDLDLVATLVANLSRAGARHADLNAKNVLVGDQAWVLDVDRVTFGWSPDDALAHNLARLDRSLRKRRERLGEMVTDAEIAEMARKAAERM